MGREDKEGVLTLSTLAGKEWREMWYLVEVVMTRDGFS